MTPCCFFKYFYLGVFWGFFFGSRHAEKHVARCRNPPGFLPKMWPQRSYNIYIFFQTIDLPLYTGTALLVHHECISVTSVQLFCCHHTIFIASHVQPLRPRRTRNPCVRNIFSPPNRYVLQVSFRWTRTCACVCVCCWSCKVDLFCAWLCCLPSVSVCWKCWFYALSCFFYLKSLIWNRCVFAVDGSFALILKCAPPPFCHFCTLINYLRRRFMRGCVPLQFILPRVTVMCTGPVFPVIN